MPFVVNDPLSARETAKVLFGVAGRERLRREARRSGPYLSG
jgi:hypothetical protein